MPAIKYGHKREDPVCTFAAARDRAREHASNNLHGVNTNHLSSVVSVPTPILQNHLKTHLDEVQATVASQIDGPKRQKRGRSKTERQGTIGRSEKHSPSSSAHQIDKKGSKERSPRATRPVTNIYEPCMRPTNFKM